MSERRGGQRRLWRHPLLWLILAQIVLGSYGISQPLVWGHQGYHVAEHGISARNLSRHDAWMPSHHSGPGTPSEESLNYRHPFMLHPYIAGANYVFGEQVWVARGVQLLFALLALTGLWAFTKRVRDESKALLACVAFLVTPLHLTFNHLPDHQLIGIAYALWAGVGLVDWLRTMRTSALCLWLGASFMAALSDWPWFLIAFCLFVVLVWRTWRGHLEDWHPDMRGRACWLGLVAFALCILAPFTAHVGAAFMSVRWEDLMLAYTDRSASGPSGHLLGSGAWRLYAMHSPPLVFVTWWWLWRMAKQGLRESGNLVMLSMFVGQSLWLVLMQTEFLVHEYRSYWYVLPAAFACADVGLDWFRRLRRAERGSFLQVHALTIVLVCLLGWSFAHLKHNLVTSRRMSGSVSFQGYDPQHEFMSALRVVRAMSDFEQTLVLIGGGLGPRKEAEYLLDRSMRVVWSPDEVKAALDAGESILVVDSVEGLKQQTGWRRLFWRARSLRIGQVVILDLRPGAQPGIDALDLVLGEDYGPMDAWLSAPLSGPLTLFEGDTRAALSLTRQMASPDGLVDSARRRGDVISSLAPELSESLSIVQHSPRVRSK